MPRIVRRVMIPESDEWVDAQEGAELDHRHYDLPVIGRHSTDVFKPDGSPLLLFRKRALDPAICEQARPALRKAGRAHSPHRDLYSRIIGYYRDNEQSNCRLTAFTRDNLPEWGNVLPFVRAVNTVFRRELPSRYKVQRRIAYQTDREWTIADTAFTTVTVNLWDATHDARTKVHRDDGDLPDGFGVISILRSGQYSGGQLIFPKYRVAVDMDTTDVLLCDVHEAHGNAPLIGEPGWERIATILYYVTSMRECAR
ncbi:MAG: hypothetical protein WD557_18735 [Dehalococcoidia bacterium]